MQGLTKELRKKRGQIEQAFLVEIHEFQQGQAKEQARHEADQRKENELKAEDAKLSGVLHASDSLHHGKRACLRGTRVAILDTLAAWAQENSPSATRLFWLHGVAGCGKSTVAASISGTLDARGRLAGSFFCKRDVEDRRNPLRLLGQLASRLARGNSSFRKALLHSLEHPDFPLIQDVKAYFEFALQKPIAAMACSATAVPLLFIIDALDECSDNEAIACCLTDIASVAPWVKLIVTSRDDPGIRKPFSSCAFGVEHNLFDHNARGDIRNYLEHELSPDGELARYRLDMEGHLEAFVERAEGLFIWPVTMVRFIADEEGNLEVVDKILGQEPMSEEGNSLYALYQTVVKRASEKSKTSAEIVRYIIGFIVASSRTAPLTSRMVHAFLPSSISVRLSAVEDILARLSPMLVVSELGIGVVHKTGLGFFAEADLRGDGTRTDLRDIQYILVTGCFEVMEHGTRNARRQELVPAGLQFNICGLDTSHLANDEVPDLEDLIEKHISPELLYSCLYWSKHLQAFFKPVPNSVSRGGNKPEVMMKMLQRFLETKRSVFWLEALSVTSKVAAARAILVHFLAQPTSPVSC